MRARLVRDLGPTPGPGLRRGSVMDRSGFTRAFRRTQPWRLHIARNPVLGDVAAGGRLTVRAAFEPPPEVRMDRTVVSEGARRRAASAAAERGGGAECSGQ